MVIPRAGLETLPVVKICSTRPCVMMNSTQRSALGYRVLNLNATWKVWTAAAYVYFVPKFQIVIIMCKCDHTDLDVRDGDGKAHTIICAFASRVQDSSVDTNHSSFTV